MIRPFEVKRTTERMAAMNYRTDTDTETKQGMTEKEIYTDREKPQWGEPDKTRHVRHTAVTRKLAFREMPPTSASLM